MWDYPQELWGRTNPDQLGGIWKDISDLPPGRILEVALLAALLAYGEEGITRKNELGQSVGAVTPTRKINKGTGVEQLGT